MFRISFEDRGTDGQNSKFEKNFLLVYRASQDESIDAYNQVNQHLR